MKLNSIRHDLSTAFDIKGDKALFDKIISDQNKNAGQLRPYKNWDLDNGGHDGQKFFISQKSKEDIQFSEYSDETYDEKYSTLNKMLDPIIGCTGLKKIEKNIVEDYYCYLKEIDHLNILPNYFTINGDLSKNADNLMITDLGSMIDINIITSFLDPKAEEFHVLEVGGGYGRLAEVFFKLRTNKKIKYVLLDAVPACLMYAYLYLSKNLPDIKIGFYYNNDPLDMDLYDCYIMPSWHFNPLLFTNTFDCCVNIQSMQEMNQYHVDYYLEMFDNILKKGNGIAYLSNEKDYVFQGNWNYPEKWKCLFKSRTPRSWTRNSPTEVFVSNGSSFDGIPFLTNSFYLKQLQEFDRNQDQLATISNLRQELDQTQQKVSGIIQKQLETSGINSIVERLALISQNDHMDELIEETIHNVDAYYCTKELDNSEKRFEIIHKDMAYLYAASYYIRRGLYRRTLSYLLRIFKIDFPMLVSAQTIKVIWSGIMIRINRNKKKVTY